MAQVPCVGSFWRWQSWVLAHLVEILFVQSSLAHTVWIPAVVVNTVVLRWRKDKVALLTTAGPHLLSKQQISITTFKFDSASEEGISINDYCLR